MIATVVNIIAVIAGSLVGLLFHTRIKESYKSIVYTGAGLISLVLGIQMSLDTKKIVFLALSLIIGGILGEWWRIEDGIFKVGDLLRRRFANRESGHDFAYAFLNASVIFCVGAMTLIGAFKAGTEGNYDLILTKSVMDGFMAILLTAAMGIGVAFSSVTIFVYQGGLTLVSRWVKPLVTDAMLSGLTAIGGILVIMIGINLLGLSKLKTANFLPGFLIIIALIALEPLFLLIPI